MIGSATVATKAQFSALQKGNAGSYTYRFASGNNTYLDTACVLVDAPLVDGLGLTHLDLFKLCLVANRKAKGSLREESSYRIGTKQMAWLKNDQIKISWEYFGENAYGAKKVCIMLVTFDKSGNFISDVVL